MSQPLVNNVALAPLDKLSPGACLLCGRNEGKVTWEEAGYEAKFCDDCGVLYLDPLPPASAVNAAYERHEDEFYSWPAKLRADWLSRVLPSGRLLEVGCGSGHFLVECRRRGYDVHGCEVDSERANYCRDKLNLDVETALIEQTQLPPKSFNIVFHVDLLSHFPNPIDALQSMARLLRPGGKLCFEVGTLAGISPRYYKWAGGLGCPDHRWFYTRDGIQNVVERAGLKIDHVTQYGLVPAMMPLVLGRALIKPLVQHARGKQARPWEGEVQEGGGPLRRVSGIYAFGHWVSFLLRYQVGRYVPWFGPTTLLIAASPR